ncbi:MAG: O-succinylhomoserine sulfhydrylase [Magnetococcales bacterium]|nr:O-succinylhomoserine sulfhydrylase [Magnetococcales bacterium]
MKTTDWPQQWGVATRALHGGPPSSPQRENSLAIFPTSSYTFRSASHAAEVFAGTTEGNLYSRFTNPTVTAFETKLALLEQGEKALATASGMAAIQTLLLSLLSQGDHVVISRSVFGSTTTLANTVLPRFGIEVTRVALADIDGWRQAMTPKTRLLFAETPSNPTLELVDLTLLAQLAREHGVWLAVDNVFCTPCLQQPLLLGADIVIHSATKYIDGQGRVLGGAIVGPEALLMERIYPFIRNTGPTLSPFNAWVLYKGMETLPLRIERHCHNAAWIATQLADRHPQLSVRYPGLPSHPQHLLAQRQMRQPGGLLCLELGSRQQAHQFIDRLQLVTITANLGDAKTLVTHPATTTHGRLSAEERLAAGVTDGLVRLAIGLEDAPDILDDIEQALP